MRHYRFAIKKDITVFELAEIVQGSFAGGATSDFYDGLGEDVKRHFSMMSDVELDDLKKIQTL